MLAAAYAVVQARAAKRSVKAAEEQATGSRRQAQAAEDSVQIMRDQLSLQRQELERSREAVALEQEQAIEASRPELLPQNDRASPGGFNLRVTEPLELSAWFTNDGPGQVLVDAVRLDLGDPPVVLSGSPRADGGAEPVRELPVPEDEGFNVYIPSSAQLTGLVNNPKRPLRLGLRYARAGERSRKWWAVFRLEPKLGDVGRPQWLATPLEVRAEEA